MAARVRPLLHRLFLLGVALKGLDGLLEIIGGTCLFFISTDTITRWVLLLLHGELVEDPHDILANHFRRLAQNLSLNTKTFAALYLVGYGLIKVTLAAGLLRNRNWAYPFALVVSSLFLLYQIERIATRYSVELAVFTSWDTLILILIWLECRARRRNTLAPGP